MSKVIAPLSVIGFVVALTAGCAAAASHPTTSTRPATQPHVVHLSSAVPLNKLRTEQTDFDLHNRMQSGGQTLYFGQLDTTESQDETTATAPVIVAKVKGEWRALSLADSRVPNAEFLFVASGPAKGEIWTVLDNQIDAPAAVVLLAHSTDAGQTWALSTVHKPRGVGSYDSFSMDKTGHGRLTVHVSGKQSNRSSGFYHFRTSDDGQTWSSPDFEPDHLKRADEVPEDEDPEPLKDLPSITTTLAPVENGAAKLPPALVEKGRDKSRPYSWARREPMGQES
jgi:hypothetical protein